MTDPIKILVCGAVNGNVKSFCNRVNNVNKKSGPFSLCLVPGPVIGADIEGWTSLRDGTYTVDVPTCILGPTQAAHVKFYSFLDEGQVAENVTYLGRRGIYTTANGLTIAYLSGVYSAPGASQQHTYSESDLAFLSAQSSVTQGVDILLNPEWPADITRHVQTPDVTVPQGNKAISHLATALKPRYHFVFGPYYERMPYRNHKILNEKCIQCTRFISLNAVGNKGKEKSLYAFSMVPMSKLADAELRKQPTQTSENPYTEVQKEAEKEVSKKEQYHFGTLGDQMGAGRDGTVGDKRGAGREQGGVDKKQASSCWFCLSSPAVEKHLVISVGRSMYLALAKGALRGDHIMIVPTTHIKCQQFLSQESQAEVEQFKRAIVKMNRQAKCTTVFWERSLSTSHMQIQAVPVPRYSVSNVKDVFYTFAEKYGLEIEEIPGGEDWKSSIPPGGDYFLVELENEDKILHICTQQTRFPLQLGREVLASEELLNTPLKVSWKECKISQQEEEKDVKKIRERFTPLNPFKDDDDSD